MKTVLVIAAHPDDEVLGIGATAARHAAEGDAVFCLILGEGQIARFTEKTAAKADIVSRLHQDTLAASRIIGYQEVFFENVADNRFDSVDLLDIIKIIEFHIDKLEPEIVYTHHWGDLNVDHRLTCEAVLTATRPIQSCPVNQVACFETLSSTEWRFGRNSEAFHPNLFVRADGYIEKKLEAMRCYQSEIRPAPHPRSVDIMTAAARKWGSVAGCDFAEAFELLRVIR